MTTMREPSAFSEKLKEAITFAAIERLVKDRAGRQLALGRYLLQQGKLAMAELCFETALREAETQTDPAKRSSIVVAALLGKAEVARRRRRFTVARKLLQQAGRAAQEADDPKMLGLVHQERAEVELSEGQPEAAHEELKAAQAAFARARDAAGERVQTALKLGVVAQQLLRLREALGHYEEAERLASGLTPPKGQESAREKLRSLALLGQANALHGLGRGEEALSRAEAAEKVLHKRADLKGFQSLIAELRASVYEAQGRTDQATEHYEQALVDASEDCKAKARLCAHLAVLHFSLGLPEEARSFERRARELLEEGKEEVPEARLALSRLQLLRGRVPEAERDFIRAVTEFTAPDRRREIALRLFQADLDLQQGLFRAAEERVRSSYEELEELKAQGADVDSLRLSALQSLGRHARLRGNVEDAERFYQEALELAVRVGPRTAVAAALAGLARAAAARSEVPLAFEYLERAVEIGRECGATLQWRSLEAELLLLQERSGEAGSSDPDLEDEDGRPTKVSPSLRDLVAEAKRLECLPLELTIETAWALHHWHQAQYEPALERLRGVNEKARRAGLAFSRIITEGLLGLLLDDMGEKAQAEQHLAEALRGMEHRGLEIEAKHAFAERFRDLTGWPF